MNIPDGCQVRVVISWPPGAPTDIDLRARVTERVMNNSTMLGKRPEYFDPTKREIFEDQDPDKLFKTVLGKRAIHPDCLRNFCRLLLANDEDAKKIYFQVLSEARAMAGCDIIIFYCFAPITPSGQFEVQARPPFSPLDTQGINAMKKFMIEDTFDGEMATIPIERADKGGGP